MKWILRAPASADSHPLELADISRPVAADDEILVRVVACGICRTDLHVVEGELSVRRSRIIPGHQVVGRVAAVGDRVQGFEVGQRVGIAWLNRTYGTCQFCASDRKIYATIRSLLAGPSTAALPNTLLHLPLLHIRFPKVLTISGLHRYSAPESLVTAPCG